MHMERDSTTPRAQVRIASVLAAALALSLGAGCSDRDEAPPGSGEGSRAAAAGAEPMLVRFEPAQRPRTRAEALADVEETELEEWETELLALPLERRLVELGGVLRESTAVEALAPFAAAELRCDELAPAEIGRAHV